LSKEGAPELEEVVRYYSPVSRPDEWGHIDLLIKTNTGGSMTDHLLEMKPGDSLDFKGPMGGPNFSVGQYKKIGMLAGGTGIAPMIQIIRSHVLQEIKLGNTPRYDLRMIYACKNEEEILLRQVLERHAQKHPNLKLYYTLLEPPENWAMGVGFVNKEIIEGQFPAASDDLLIIICGPPPFCNAMKKLLDSMNYSKDRHYYSYL
jgi:cytochrome-b5 reductase